MLESLRHSAKLAALNNLLGQLFLRSRYVPAAGSGIILAAAFPSFGMAGFAWIAPALLLASAYGKTGGDAFRIGYAGGLAHFLFSLCWLLRIPAKGFPILGWFALSSFLALYLAIWVWLLSGDGTLNQIRNPNVEIRKKPESRNPKSKLAATAWALRFSGFGIHSSFVIHHSSFHLTLRNGSSNQPMVSRRGFRARLLAGKSSRINA